MAARAREFLTPVWISPSYRRFLELSERLNAISQRFFFWRSIGSVWDIVDRRSILQPSLLRALLDMHLGRSVSATVRSQVSDARFAQMLDHFTQYVGSAPDQSPAVLCGIAHMQTNEGVWYPRGGTGTVPRALESLARVSASSCGAGSVCGAFCWIQAAVCGGWKPTSERKSSWRRSWRTQTVCEPTANCSAACPQRRFQSRRRYEPACSGVVLYLGLDRGYEHLAHHNFVFSHNPEEEFEAIYRKGEPASDPTCYLAAPARTEPQVAPPRGEALYVLVHTPYLRPHHDWKKAPAGLPTDYP